MNENDDKELELLSFTELDKLEESAPSGYMERYEQGDKTVIKDAEEFRRLILEWTQVQSKKDLLLRKDGGAWLYSELSYARELLKAFTERIAFLEEQRAELEKDRLSISERDIVS